ncbi:keratin-associated protein 15-1-like [Lepus europaeus]|uniref:keratin-associated protein 15-1-like n=1 Tax=Lepus europaeus TaxID=9983 RepID=UPI002B478938|nr:keratin-associated protein 15-1-like [Lepus europaeus]
MSYNCSSGNFSSRSFGNYLGNSVSTCHSFYPTNVVYSPRTHQVGSSLQGTCQETFSEPTGFQTSFAVTRPCHTSFYRPKNSIFFSPCQTNYTGSFGYGNTGFGSFGYGNTGFHSVGCGSNFFRPTYFSSRSSHSTCYQPVFGSHCFGSSH